MDLYAGWCNFFFSETFLNHQYISHRVYNQKIGACALGCEKVRNQPHPPDYKQWRERKVTKLHSYDAYQREKNWLHLVSLILSTIHATCEQYSRGFSTMVRWWWLTSHDDFILCQPPPPLDCCWKPPTILLMCTGAATEFHTKLMPYILTLGADRKALVGVPGGFQIPLFRYGNDCWCLTRNWRSKQRRTFGYISDISVSNHRKLQVKSRPCQGVWATMQTLPTHRLYKHTDKHVYKHKCFSLF